MGENRRMADWTQLPTVLLVLISERLATSYDVIHFRSVCSTWRSTVTSPNRHRPALCSLKLPRDGPGSANSLGFTLSKRTVFLLRSPKIGNETNSWTSWVIKIKEGVQNSRIQLLKPFSSFGFDSLPGNFPKALNLMDFGVVELGYEYVLHTRTRPVRLSMRKVIVSHLGNDVNDFILLAILDTGRLTMFKSSDKKWVRIQDELSYDDVISYEGNFYAVDRSGRIMLVGLDFERNVVGMPVFGGKKKFLIESKGELLLVVMHVRNNAGLYSSDKVFEDFASYMNERTVLFKVFKLDEGGKQWVEEAKNLADRVLVLGDECSFSVSAEELCLCRGNWIIFSGDFFFTLMKHEVLENLYAGVFDLDNGSAGPIQNFPQFSKLFWPPPHWISSTTSDAQMNTRESA